MPEYWMWLAVVWATSGFLGYGISFGFFQRKFPTIAVEGRLGDQIYSAFIAVNGPIGLIAIVLGSGFCRYGLKWR